MTDQEKQIKMDLLQELIDEMGGSAVESHLGKKTSEPKVAQVTETKEVPVEELPELIKDKIAEDLGKKDESLHEDMPHEGMPHGEIESDEDDSEDSDFIQRLKAVKAKLAAQK